MNQLKLGVSSCLLGEKVRYDGKDKKSEFIYTHLKNRFQLISYCPELSAGLGVPRPTIQLTNIDGDVQVRGVEQKELNPSQALIEQALVFLESNVDLSGYILKSKSPSCSVKAIPVFDLKNQEVGHGTGLFVSQLIKQLPLLPLIDENDLLDKSHSVGFFNQVQVYSNWQKLTQSKMSASQIIDFHSQHKYLVMLFSQSTYLELGQLLSDLKSKDLSEVANIYIQKLLAIFDHQPKIESHINVLQHIQAYFKNKISDNDYKELGKSILELKVHPQNLQKVFKKIDACLKVAANDYLSMQVYLNQGLTEDIHLFY